MSTDHDRASERVATDRASLCRATSKRGKPCGKKAAKDGLCLVHSGEALVDELVESGDLQLLVTHIQQDELADIKDGETRRRIASIPREVVPTYGFVLGTARLDMARLGEDEPIEAIRAPNWPKYTNDALIAATAQCENVTLLTEERRLRNRAPRELGIEAWNWPTFHSYLVAMSAKTAI